MCLNMTEEKGFTNLDECKLRFEETDYQTPVINYPIYPHRSNLFLPIYYPQSWYYPDRLVDLSYHERPYGESTRSFQLVQNRNDEIERPLLEKKNPLFLDDIRSAALALTSLSLASPASNLPSVDDHSKARSADSAFIFPPKNTPTEEGQHFANSRVTTTYSDYMHGNISRLTTSPRSFDEAKRHGLTAECISRSPRISESKEYERDNSETRYGKPRSYSHRDFNKELTQPVPIISKPRSYSFDAVGRANKHIYGSDHTHDNVIGYQSAPHSHSQMIQGRLGRCSVDEGIGSSSGSVDSVEHAPTKRKLPSRTIFRCMWRGCDKELNTLSGIILHVRHAHIGPSKAGEEEFYFDDVNVDSTTTSGISSSEESLSEECSKSKYRKSITEDDLFEKMKEEENLENNVFECDYGLSLNKKESLNVSRVIRTTESEPGCVKITELRPVCTSNEKQSPSLCPLTMLAATHQLDSSSQNNSTSVLSNKTTARHLDSPVFNINFTDNLPTSELNTTSTRIFIPTEGMHRVRGKGRKKCRKVYGMSNKKLWCTQCRWKKACARFT